MPSSLPRLLIVDDDPSNLLLLEELLTEDYKTISAKSGLEALELAIAFRPDLILLDIMMPEMDGYEVCRRLRSDVRLQAIPIIFVTALDDVQSRLRGLEMMGDDYLTKPINTNLLLTKIKSIVRLNRMRSQAAQVAIAQQVKEQSRHQITAAWQVNLELSEKFRLFVPEQFLDRIAPAGVDSIRLGNAREEELTILFCDIRGFTSIAESQGARETYEWLNAFFTSMSQAIASCHGFIDKFLGDALMAVFDRSNHHAQDAINAALMMQQNLAQFNQNRQSYHLEQPVKVGIGIHTGVGVIGTIGSTNRMDSTVIGDVVNTAARLEDLTKFYNCPILASGTVVEKLGQSSSYRWRDRIAPRGKQQVLELYEVLIPDLAASVSFEEL